MVTAVVQAHPLGDSYSAALLERAVAGLDAAGAAHRVWRVGEGERPTPDELATHERLALVYPTWWGGPPAMLLDWLQQMLAAGAFASIRRLQAATTHGSSRLVNTVQGEWGRRFLADRVAGACRPGTDLEWHALYKIDRRSPSEIADFLAETEAFFAA